MTTRRSIFKCIPAMIAAAVLPKAWTARASEPDIMSEIKQINDGWSEKSFALVGETGPEFIAFDGRTWQEVMSNTVTTVSNSTTVVFDSPDGWKRNAYTGQPLGFTFGRTGSE